MDWNKGFSALYYAAVVDSRTWRSIKRFEMTGGSIKTKISGLRQSADLNCRKFDLGEAWIRVHMVAKQGDSSLNIPIFTGLSSCPEDDIDGFRTTNKVELYSVLKPCEDVLLPRGWYILAGANGAEAIKELLSVSPAPILVEDEAPALRQTIIAEDGETHLSMAENILTAMNWRLRIEGDGSIHICKKSAKPVASFDAVKNDVLEPKMSKTYDWYSCPNVFRAVMDDMSAVARDDSPNSFLSTVNRGREIWMEETSCNLSEGESLMDYAKRRLKEEQMVSMVASYDRRFMPQIQVTDVINLNYPAQGLTGDFMVTSQTIQIGHGARTSEEVMKI